MPKKAAKSINELLIEAYRRMADLTAPKCGKDCGIHNINRCCDPFYCEITEMEAKDEGVTLERTNHPTLPFMGPHGCTVPPHLRKLCTLHNCDICSLGFHPKDAKWTKEYFKLRNVIERLEGRKSRERMAVQVLPEPAPADADHGVVAGQAPQTNNGTDQGTG